MWKEPIEQNIGCLKLKKSGLGCLRHERSRVARVVSTVTEVIVRAMGNIRVLGISRRVVFWGLGITSPNPKGTSPGQ